MASSADLIWEEVPIEGLDRYWPHVEPFISAATSRVPTHLNPGMILARAVKRECNIWVIYDRRKPLPLLGTVVTSIHKATDGQVLTIEALGGCQIHRWARWMLADFEKVCAENGIDKIEFEGRFGWLRLLREDGYRAERIVVSKRIR